MDIQGIMQHPAEGHHFMDMERRLAHHRPPSPVLTPSSFPSLVPNASSVHSDVYKSASINKTSSSLGFHDEKHLTASEHPPSMVPSKHKRKSSPAILGLLDLSEEAEAQLRLHLSRHRNSIEAAVLLATFNRSVPTTANHSPVLGPVKENPWQDDLPTDGISSWPDSGSQSSSHSSGGSVSNSHRNNTGGDAGDSSSSSHAYERRYSYDQGLSWDKMSAEFIERSSLAPKEYKRPPPQRANDASPTSDHSAGPLWIHEDGRHIHHHRPMMGAPYATSTMHPQARFNPTTPFPPLHPAARADGSSSPFGPPSLRPILPPSLPHPLSPSSQVGSHKRHYTSDYHQPYFYPYPRSLPPSMPTTPGYYGEHPPPFPTVDSESVPEGGSLNNTVVRRKKPRTDEEDDELGGRVAPGDPGFPDMSERDIVAARNDVDARPRRQKLRFPGDLYTPQWVRYNGQAKEGLCNTCKPGKWLQLKNSAFWYHKQFYHGISSVSGREFIQPVETRWVEQDLLEGLCHQCHQWVAVSNVKRKNSVLWYRHAHKCHVYHKPKTTVPVKRR